MSGTGGSALQGRRVLVAEDEYLMAEEVVQVLEEAGVVVIGPVATIEEAGELASAPDLALDAAVVDANLQGRMIWPVLDLLAGRGIPVVLATGYDAGAVPPAYASVARCEKPVTAGDLLRALARRIEEGN